MVLNTVDVTERLLSGDAFGEICGGPKAETEFAVLVGPESDGVGAA